MLDFIGFCLKSPKIEEKWLFLGTMQSDFMGLSPDTANTACNEAVFKNGAAEKNVRALSTAHRKRPALPSILRRTFPALRFRTENYDKYK